MSRAAFIAKDTKTYMNLEEAWYRFKRERKGSLLFVVIPKDNTNNLKNRIKEVIDENKWEKVIWVETLSNNFSSSFKLKMRRSRLLNFYVTQREYLYNLADRIRIDRIAGMYKPCDLVVSAHKNTQEHLAAALEPERLYLTDSGHRIFERINRSGFIDYSDYYRKKRLRRLLYRLTGLKVFDRTRTTLFTTYADEIETAHPVEKNSYAYQKHLLRTKKTGEDIVWISTPIHSMAEGVKLQAYIDYMKISLNLLGVNPASLIYIPHPSKENPEDIGQIKHALGCRTDARDLPVEMKIAHYDTLPALCISPFSSALVNISVASEGHIRTCSAWHFEFNFFSFWTDWREDVERNPELPIEFLDVTACTPFFHIDPGPSSNSSPYTHFRDWETDTTRNKMYP